MGNLTDYKSRFRILKGGKISLIISALVAGSTMTFASPSGGVVNTGSAAISQSGSITSIDQSTQRASINWQSFSIGSSETVNFNQPNSSAITLNRVVGNESSVINGALNANGQVWILNSNGLLFGQGASINTAGVVASTMNISDADFMAGSTTLQSAGSTASVINRGTINITDGGYAALLGKEVANQGLIQAIKGTVALASGDKITLNFNGDSLIGIVIDQGIFDALVQNQGAIIADGGNIFLTTQAANDILNGVVNNTGLLQAQTLDDITGHIEVYARGGTANIGGALNAAGGFVETSGTELSVTQGTTVNAGRWLIDPVNVTIDAAMALTLEGQLAGGNAFVTTSGMGTDEGNINVNSAIGWSAHTLNLIADNNININAVMSATGSAGLDMTGNVKVGFNSGEAAGFAGRVDMASGTSLRINGNSYTIINTLGLEGSMTGTDLQGISLAPEGHYALGNTIDASGTSTWNGGNGFMPLGVFTGIFDGLGHEIIGLSINRPAEINIGLFGATNGATIKNIGLVGENIRGDSYVGGLVGGNNGSNITNSYTAGLIGGSYCIGGMIGYSNGSPLANSYSTASIISSTGIAVGGLVGDNENGSDITNSYATGAVNGTMSIGGLVGFNDSSVIANSYAAGAVRGTNFFIGGLIGENYGTITDSHATGTVNGGSGTGGLAGYTDEYSVITNSYATGAVVGINSVGGLVGDNRGTITDSYATGTVEGADSVGGLAGYNENSITNSYARGIITGDNNFGGLIGQSSSSTILKSFYDKTINPGLYDEVNYGRTTIQMQDITLYAGWDIIGDALIDKGYPALMAFGADHVWVIGTKVAVVEPIITPSLEEMINNIITSVTNESMLNIEAPETIVATGPQSGSFESTNSIIEILDSGINLPDGIEEEES